MKTIHALLATMTNFLWWAGVFAACRIAVWMAARPAWWTIPAALAVGTAWLGVKAAQRTRSGRGTAGRETGGVSESGLRARMAAAWNRGTPLRAGRPFEEAPPLYLFFDLAQNGSAPTLELADASDQDTAAFGDEFTWHRGPGAVWIDYPAPHLRNDGGRWAMFAEQAARARFAGAAITLDAARLAMNDMSGAAVLRSRLESLRKTRSGALPVYLVLDNIDRLYGLRSLASRLDPERVPAPVGDFRDPSKEKSPAFFRRVLAGAAARIEAQGGAEAQSRTRPDPASLLAPAELARLEEPLTRFCRQVFHAGKSGGKNGLNGDAPWIRGLFLAASAPGGGDQTPPALARLSAFAPAHEPFPVQPWFLRDLFRDAVPADAGDARMAQGGVSGRFANRLFPAQAAAALAGGLILSLFVTWSFLENRSVLLSARGRAAAPATADSLEEYRELAAGTRLRADGWTLPRFGMTEAEDLASELQKRYTESYFDLKTVPGVERVQDAALAAVENGSPPAIGNALLLLAVARDGIVRALGEDGNDGQTQLLRALANSLRLITPGDARQLETYFAWAGRRDWMPETAAKLAEFEKYVVDNAMGGDLGWLPEWVGALPGLRAVDTSRVWSVPLADDRLSLVAPAWTREGYAVAKGLLDAVAYGGGDPEAWRARREAFLSAYRAKALERWRIAAAVLWSKFRRRVSDGEVHALIGQAARGDDPASRFASLLRHHLLPMFEDDPAGSDPDVAWLFLRERLELSRFDRKEAGGAAGQGGFANRFVGAVREWGSDESLDRWSRKFGLAEGGDNAGAAASAGRWREALRRFGAAASSPEENFAMIRAHFRASRNGADVSSFDPLFQAGREAALLHGYLRDRAGSAAWDGLSPLAVYDYIRYLSTRQAALHLDALWREDVYDPAHLAPGSDGDRLERVAEGGGALERFLTGTAAGFWSWDGEGLTNAEWSRLPFMFDPSFLDFCRKALREKRPGRPDRLELPFRVWAVDVDRDAVERPVRVEFVLASGGGEQVVAFNNFRIEETLVWNMDADATAEMRVVFPSVTATVGFGGKGGLRNFVSAFRVGEARFEAGLFGDKEAVLRRLGVSRVTVRARVENGDEVAGYAREESVALPRSVIVPGAARY